MRLLERIGDLDRIVLNNKDTLSQQLRRLTNPTNISSIAARETTKNLNNLSSSTTIKTASSS